MAITAAKGDRNLTRKLNADFRRKVVKFEEGVLDAKLESMATETYNRIAQALDNLYSEYTNRLEVIETELAEEMDEKLQTILANEDEEYVASIVENEYSKFRFEAVYDVRERTELFRDNDTSLDFAKSAPIKELKVRYAEALAEYEEEVQAPYWKRFGFPEPKPKAMAAAAEIPSETPVEQPQPPATCAYITTQGVCGHELVDGKCRFTAHNQ